LEIIEDEDVKIQRKDGKVMILHKKVEDDIEDIEKEIEEK
jgi:hypothetical protein